MKKLVLTLVMMALSVLPVLPAQLPAVEPDDLARLQVQLNRDPQNPELLMAVSWAYFHKGAAGDAEAVKEAESFLELLLEIQPDNAEARSLYGSVLAMRARDAWFPLFKADYVNRGMKEMDQAVVLSPDNIDIRMVRAKTSMALPAMFNRTDTAIEDFEYLKQRKEQDPSYMNQELYLDVLYNLGKAYAVKGEPDKARACLTSVRTAAPDSELAQNAVVLMAKLDQSNGK